MKKYVPEAEIIHFSQNKFIESLHIDQIKNGHYEIYVLLKGSSVKYYVQTQRGTVRTWVSLDRLVGHIRKNYKHIDKIYLKLKKEIHYEKKH